MCLTIKQNAKERIAKRDIIVYKWLEEDEILKSLRTPYRLQPIKIDKTYESDLLLLFNNNIITVGLHSFERKMDAVKDIMMTAFGFNPIIVRCIIPKGSKYYKGVFYNKIACASNSIKYVKRLNFKLP